MIVAIDGPAGVGKSTIAKLIAAECNLFYINSGNFYRAVAFKHLKMELDPENKAEIIKTAAGCDFKLVHGELYLDGKEVEAYLKTPEIDMASSRFSSIIEVRKIINKALRKSAAGLDVIMEGRDITSVVFPDADVKCYFDAAIEIRARRRFEQFSDKNTADYQTYLEEIRKRDHNDKNKPFGALVRMNDAIYIDTSYLTIEEVCDKVVQKIFDLKSKQNDWEKCSGNREKCREK